MKRKTGDTMIQSAVWLPRDVHQRLKHAGGERGMGEEIRRRLEASFEAGSMNYKTQELLTAISYFADEADNNYGPWSENVFAFEVLKACVDLLLAIERPKGEAVPPAADTNTALLWGNDPKDISRILVGGVMRSRTKHATAREKKR